MKPAAGRRSAKIDVDGAEVALPFVADGRLFQTHKGYALDAAPHPACGGNATQAIHFFYNALGMLIYTSVGPDLHLHNSLRRNSVRAILAASSFPSDGVHVTSLLFDGHGQP